MVKFGHFFCESEFSYNSMTGIILNSTLRPQTSMAESTVCMIWE